MSEAVEDDPAYEDGLRRMVADAHGTSYRAFPSLDDARRERDAALVMQGDDGGSIYLTCPVRHVHCPEATLRRLLLDLDRRVWNDPGSARLFYELAPVGNGIAGGIGGGAVVDGVWLHPELAAMDVRGAVEAVIAGQRESIA